MLKLGISIVLLGGGAAFTAGKLSVKSVEDRLEAHEHTAHPLLLAQMEQAQRASAQASYDATYSRIMTEALLRANGVPLPKPPPLPELLSDAGAPDAGIRDGGP